MRIIIALLLISILPSAAADKSYSFVEKKGESIDLLYGDQKVIRYMNKPRDGTTKDMHELTFKPFHHVYDPANGETLLTNGAGHAADKANLFPHHRGIFYAFNKITYGDKSCDVWHGRNGEFVLHDSVLSQVANKEYGRQKCKLLWCGKDGKTFATEERELTASLKEGSTQIDFDSVLKTNLTKVRLDGDPQHAGFHFRAAMEVAQKTKGQTYYLRPDGKGEPGNTRNWDAKTRAANTVNLPWDACSFIVAGNRYTVLRMVHPSNPKEWRGSERDYGRFGDYFEWDLTPKTPLHVKYRLFILPGEMTVDQCTSKYREFTSK